MFAGRVRAANFSDQIRVHGIRFNELNAPYDSKVVGNYTGLTAP